MIRHPRPISASLKFFFFDFKLLYQFLFRDFLNLFMGAALAKMPGRRVFGPTAFPGGKALQVARRTYACQAMGVRRKREFRPAMPLI